MVANDFEDIFKQGFDFILTPTAPTPAIPLAQFSKQSPIEVYSNDIFTIPASLAGLPAISVPVTLSKQSGLPLGLQVISGSLMDANVLKAAHALETYAKLGHPNGFTPKQ